jgi:ribosomal-protein-alanine N-acetyltransferase
MNLTIPQASDYAEWSSLRKASADYLKPFEPPPGADEYSADRFRRRVKSQDVERARDQAYAFFIRNSAGAMVGGLTLGPVRRACIQSALLGTWIGRPYAGRGYAVRATRRAVNYAFGAREAGGLRLHRVEACCLTTNDASIRGLEHLGFKREGVAKAYWFIDGRWQDHFLYAVNQDEWVRPLQAQRAQLAAE